MRIDKLLTVSQAAEKEGVSRQTIYDWMIQDVLSYTQIGFQRFMMLKDLRKASKIMAERRNGGRSRKKHQ